jgi:acetyl/propionyl-CoA carboxylase alpha subunit
MIKRVLIANRGEIALRVVHACRELGIETVAVYSDADIRSPHVAAADRSVHIGPAPAIDSYLSIERLIDAARRSGADAVHPGYGFLSQNPSFASACQNAGIVFVGPPASVLVQMGSKIAARRLMETAGVPIVPGETPRDQSDSGIAAAVERVGLPALVKASAGGGGKGMRRVDPGDDIGNITEAVQAARREAIAAFGDGALYVERLIPRPRHVEVQVFADNHGNVAHLFERECSVQRRHQKVIEESPSPVANARLRSRMTEAAVRAARASGYRNAGTVEFLVDASAGRGAERFYYLEMNTRLQVEHAVTEQVTGVDLVRAQLLVASNEPLPWSSSGITQRGHAIEARIYAEDPARGFLPQAGRILLYREPRMPGIRVDSGVEEGSDVPLHYDPLLAKVIATGSTREEAIRRLVCALREFPILGVRTNIEFLVGVLEHPRFRAGNFDTGWLDAEGESLTTTPGPAEVPAHVQAAIGAYESESRGEAQAERPDPWQSLREWRS